MSLAAKRKVEVAHFAEVEGVEGVPKEKEKDEPKIAVAPLAEAQRLTTPTGLVSDFDPPRECLDGAERAAAESPARPMRVAVRWSARFSELVAYHEEHRRIPPPFIAGGLGRWVTNQRQRLATMDPERKARLDALEWWTWATVQAGWDARFDELCAYHAEHGEMPPPSTPGLGVWVRHQRACRAKMGPERKARLSALEWWAWALALRPRVGWPARYEELVAYYAEHRTLPQQCAPSGLGRWVCVQRRGRATMDAERKAKLDALAWWTWDAPRARRNTCMTRAVRSCKTGE